MKRKSELLAEKTYPTTHADNERGIMESHQYQIEINKEFQREGFVAGYEYLKSENDDFKTLINQITGVCENAIDTKAISLDLVHYLIKKHNENKNK